MDDFLKNRVQKLVKAMKSKVRHKNAVEDVLDANNTAEMSLDLIATDKTSAMKKKDKECDCKNKDNCECDEIAPCDDEIEKAEKFVKSVLNNFKIISDAYFKKMEEFPYKEARDRAMAASKAKKAMKDSRKEKIPKYPSKKDLEHPTSEDIERAKKQKVPKTKKSPEQRKKTGRNDDSHKHPTDVKNPKYPSKKDLEHPFTEEKMAASEMAKKQGVPKGADPATHERCVKKVKKKGHDKSSAYAICNEADAGMDKKEGRCWEGYEPTPGKKPYSEGSCQKKSEGSEKPFHGYNKEKHSKKGGLSEKERNKINRETGSNLKAPVSSKEAKKSPKKAARRKSFCARMSGNKGPISKDGKLTPKGAALKRWDC